MKQLFIVLVALNLGYLLLQGLSASPAAEPPERTAEIESPPQLQPQAQPQKQTQPQQPEPTESAVAEPALLVTGAPAEPVASAPDVEESLPETAAELAEVAPPAASATAVSCVIAGPFRRRSDGEALLRQLANAGIDGALERRDTQVLPDYMVYVGPQDTVAAARRLESTFRQRKMDSHLIADGELANALSLGVFSRQPLAITLQEQLIGDGYDARIAELTRNRRGYQIQAELPPLIRARLAEADTPMIDCPAPVATASR